MFGWTASQPWTRALGKSPGPRGQAPPAERTSPGPGFAFPWTGAGPSWVLLTLGLNNPRRLHRARLSRQEPWLGARLFQGEPTRVTRWEGTVLSRGEARGGWRVAKNDSGILLFPEKVREIQEKLEAFIEALHQEEK